MNVEAISDSSGLRRVFAKANFDVNRFVRNTTRNGVQATENMVDKLTRMSDDASNKMKRAVFDNYRLFIKAGKAASQLEALMHEINSDFTEKERVINALVEMSLFGEPMPEPVDVEKELLVARPSAAPLKQSEFAGSPVSVLSDLVEGSACLLDDPSRKILLDGEVRELSTETYSLICVARLFLLTDTLVVAYHQSGRTASHPYRIQAAYQLDQVVAANVPARDRRHTPTNGFKLLVYPASRLFQTENANDKQLWLRAIEDATRAWDTQTKNQASRNAKASADPNRDSAWPDDSFLRVNKVPHPSSDIGSTTSITQPDKLPVYAVAPSSVLPEAARETLKALSATLPECAELFTPLADEPTPVPIRKNPFDEPSGLQVTDSSGKPISGAATKRSPHDWLWAVPEDLDVAISERDFARSTDLIVKARGELDRILVSYDVNDSRQLETSNDESMRKTRSKATGKVESDSGAGFLVDGKPRTAWEALSKRIANNQKCLAEALEHELITAAERHGAPRTIHAAVGHLGALGKSTLAAQLFLVYRSNVMFRALTRGVRQEGNQLVYLNRLSFAFHRNLAETASEWQKNVVAPLTAQQTTTGVSGETKSNQLTEQLLALRLCSWVLEETDKFAHQLRLLLVDSRSVSFCTTCVAAQRMQAHASKLTELIGVDIYSALRFNLIRAWRRAAEDQSTVLRDAVEHRSRQETWEPISSLPETEQETYLNELCEMGLIGKRSDLLGLPLTVSTCQLIRSLYQFIQSGRRLECVELEPTLSRCAAQILRVQLEQFVRALASPTLAQKRSAVLLNVEFIVEHAIPKLTKQMDLMNYREMRSVHDELRALLA